MSNTLSRKERAHARATQPSIGRWVFAGFMLALIAMPALATAQDQLRLGELYETARLSNPGVAAARARADAARSRVSSARLPADPELELAFMNRELPGLAPMPGVGMTQLTLMQMLPVAGQLGLKGSIARSQATAAAELAGESEWEVRAAVAMAFYDLYAAERQIAVTREALRLLEDIRLTAESMYRVGEGRQADVLRAQVQIAREAEDTLRMVAMRDAMAAKLEALLGGPGTEAAADRRALLDSLSDSCRCSPVRSGARLTAAARARGPQNAESRGGRGFRGRDFGAAREARDLARSADRRRVRAGARTRRDGRADPHAAHGQPNAWRERADLCPRTPARDAR